MPFIRNIKEFFYSKIEFIPFHDCWEWTAGKNKDGYGKIQIRGKSMTAHRVSYELHNSPIPKGMCICHKCDNPGCVNPGHLFIGTNTENTKDRDFKERQARGETGGNATLSSSQVREIREKYFSDTKYTHRGLAKQYGVSKFAIHCIVTKKTWRHI